MTAASVAVATVQGWHDIYRENLQQPDVWAPLALGSVVD